MTLRVKFTVATVGCLAAVIAIGAWQLNTRMAAAFEAEARNRSGMVLSFGRACRKYTKQVLRPAVAERLDEIFFEAMSSTVVTSGILAFFNEDMPSYAYRQPTLNPLNLTNKADEFEASLLADFRADRSVGETSGYRVTNGEEQFYTARPIVVEATCLECHGNPDTAPPEVLARYGREHGYNWRVGKVVAATMISVPTDDLRQKQSALTKTILVTFAALTAILFGLIFLLFDRLVNHRLRAAADMMDRAAANPTSRFRLLESSTDEIGVMARAFNRMIDAVASNAENLDRTVYDRTAELTAEIAQRKRTEAELRAAKKASEVADQSKSEFLANMSHEIRTPMTAILGFVKNLFDSSQSESGKLNSIHTIRRNGESLLSIINDILDLSKIEAGKMTVEHITCEPCRVIAEVASLMRVRADERSIPFKVEYMGTIPETISTDPARLRQILINLLGNAIKFTEVGAVRLVTRFVNDNNEPRLQFDVIDTGRGMTEEQVGKLFQPFMQADTSTTRKFGGTGLGLTISKRFAGMLGGDIAVVETEIGGGTTVRATVATGPLEGVKMLDDPMSATTVADAAHSSVHIERTDLEGCRILLAEDGPDNQRLISLFLKKAGADVTVEENGKLAVEKVLAAMNQRREGDPERPFDIILMDMQMPVMDGYEATSLLRQKGYTAPIIALTAHAMATDREKCIKAGCDDYASKPIDRKKLIEMIQQHLVPAEAASSLAT